MNAWIVAHKEIGSAHLQQMFSESLQFLRICSIGSLDIEEAAAASWEDFEDCLIDIAAKKVKADFIITRDLKGFTQSHIPVLSARQFIEWLEKEKGLTYEPLEY